MIHGSMMPQGSMAHGSMIHGSMIHGSMIHGSMNHGSRILDPGSWIQDPGPRTIQKIHKIGKCHETDKYPTKSDEIWSIWSQTGQGNLFRGVPDQKKSKKCQNLGFGRRNEVRLGLSRTSVYETTESDAPGALG